MVAGFSDADDDDAKVVADGVVAGSGGFKGIAEEDASGDRVVLCEDLTMVLGQERPAASASRLCSIVEEIEKTEESAETNGSE